MLFKYHILNCSSMKLLGRNTEGVQRCLSLALVGKEVRTWQSSRACRYAAAREVAAGQGPRNSAHGTVAMERCPWNVTHGERRRLKRESTTLSFGGIFQYTLIDVLNLVTWTLNLRSCLVYHFDFSDDSTEISILSF